MSGQKWIPIVKCFYCKKSLRYIYNYCVNSVCYTYICKTCLPWSLKLHGNCSICPRTCCPGCTKTCNICGIYICYACVKDEKNHHKCDVCDLKMCKKCSEKCSKCNMILCIKCYGQCSCHNNRNVYDDYQVCMECICNNDLMEKKEQDDQSSIYDLYIENSLDDF